MSLNKDTNPTIQASNHPRVYNYIFLVAEAREVAPLLSKSTKLDKRRYEYAQAGKTALFIITGVGKASIKLSLKKLSESGCTAGQYINVGNCGSLQYYKRATIIEVGTVIGANGKERFVLQAENPFVLASVNSLIDKEDLKRQYPSADLVDMELFTIINKVKDTKVSAYKIVLDTFKESPKSLFFKIFIGLMIAKNAKKLSKFILQKYFRQAF